MKVIIGLGNPDKKYEKTYHNIGFLFVDKVCSKLGISLTKKKFESLYGEGTFNDEKIIILKPQTYMNESGSAALAVINKLKVKAEDIIICLDDIDLETGIYRFRERGSAGTHNGLRDIIRKTGTEEFKRIRFGVGRDEKMPLADYVLSNINSENMIKIEKAMEEALDFLFNRLL